MRKLAEIEDIERLSGLLGPRARTAVIGRAAGTGEPLHQIEFGNPDPAAPVLGLVGGVHGLERIGAQVCLSLLQTFSQLALWDPHTQELLRSIRVFFVPVVNPWGVAHRRRANFNGVDLMRNAPVEAEGRVTPGVGGQRFSARLPWYRGDAGRLEPEAAALVAAVEAQIARSRLAVTVDFHSGFGLQDRLWFPYAKSTVPFPDLARMHAFQALFARTYPHHFYRIEPQAANYTTHGDLWDHLYDRHRAGAGGGAYLPLAVEMGSWNWVRKNPLQFFSPTGPYNPVKPHRLRRALRRHNTLFEFLLRATAAPAAWAELDAGKTEEHRRRGLDLWYGGAR